MAAAAPCPVPLSLSPGGPYGTLSLQASVSVAVCAQQTLNVYANGLSSLGPPRYTYVRIRLCGRAMGRKKTHFWNDDSLTLQAPVRSTSCAFPHTRCFMYVKRLSLRSSSSFANAFSLLGSRFGELKHTRFFHASRQEFGYHACACGWASLHPPVCVLCVVGMLLPLCSTRGTHYMLIWFQQRGSERARGEHGRTHLTHNQVFRFGALFQQHTLTHVSPSRPGYAPRGGGGSTLLPVSISDKARERFCFSLSLSLDCVHVERGEPNKLTELADLQHTQC